ncbi:MAG: methyltransferase domain-containing protein [Candidatus Lokiarchaeota archaeon]|nr:methyltransferase domain-containing protein [Candidatus Lokiarchaeota archaeon]
MIISSIYSKIKKTIKIVKWEKFALKYFNCPICGFSILIRLDDNDLGVRCLTCGSSVITLSLVTVLKNVVPKLTEKVVYELSSNGPLFNFLKYSSKLLVFSEYFDDVKPGNYKNGIQCQDVQELTYPDNSFDICTSTEVFEHVPDDRKAFSEMFRVLKPEGALIFTVPLNQEYKTIERAVIENGKIQHILPPEYHGDKIRGWNKVLCFRNYGKDICQRISNQGFTLVEIVKPDLNWFGLSHFVVVAHK